MHFCKIVASCLLLSVCGVAAADRINHEGRILGPEPVVTTPILFNTPEADAALSAMQIFPRDSAWNEDISRRPLLANSDAMVAQIIADLRSDRRTLRPFYEMNFVLVPDSQPNVPIDFFNYADESDPGPYPIPANMPVETWPRETGNLTLSEWQRDIEDTGGDRHSIIVMPGVGALWETWLTRLTSSGWEASNGAKFDLKSNALRPAGWTSADAAGLPMFPALVRYDECQRGMVEHAMRLIVRRTRLGPIYPATHHASVGSLTDPNIPAMGQRLRLKSSFEFPETWTIYEKAVLRGLKKYGAIVADNGNFFSISVTPDHRYPPNAFSRLSSISITNFEVIATTARTEGPRAPAAPAVNAGPDFSVAPNAPVLLAGTSSNTTSTEWKLYSGPGEVVLSNPWNLQATATFSAPGEYILMLAGSDLIHTPSYDALRVTVEPTLAAPITVTVSRNAELVTLGWNDTGSSYTIEESTALGGSWNPLSTTTEPSLRIEATNHHRFFRVRSNE